MLQSRELPIEVELQGQRVEIAERVRGLGQRSWRIKCRGCGKWRTSLYYRKQVRDSEAWWGCSYCHSLRWKPVPVHLRPVRDAIQADLHQKRQRARWRAASATYRARHRPAPPPEPSS